MELISVRELFKEKEKFAGKEVTVGGWIRSVRDSKTFGFIVLSDGTYFETLQVVYHDNMENFAEVSKLNVGSAVIVKGELVLTPDAKQPFEIQASEVIVEGKSTSDYPLQKKRHSMEYLRTISHLRPRTNTFQAVFRVRSLIAYAIHKFFQERDFVYVHTPIITGSDAEGAGEMFRVTTLDLNDLPLGEDGKVDDSKDFFGKATNLTVSGQLNGETFAMAFKNIYTFGPTFRAENSNTTRHAAEFWMIEPEIAFADLDDDMDLAESMLKYIINYVHNNAAPLTNGESVDVAQKYLQMLNGVLLDKTLILYLLAFSISLLVVWCVRRLSMDYAWDAGILAGILTMLFVFFLGNFWYGVGVNIVPLLLGLVLAGLLAELYRFLVFSVDYTRTEYSQFEDDDYYYYVKAVPKITVAAPEPKTQTINTPKRSKRSADEGETKR